jgi:hypothetical protein
MARTVEQLEKSIAYYQRVNAQMIHELVGADQLLRKVGFEEGLETVKGAAQEIISLSQDRTEIL